MQIAQFAPGLEALAVPIGAVCLNPANTRKHLPHGIEALKTSLSKYGQRKPIVVQKQGMIVRAGNGCLQAARALGWTHIAAVVVDEPNVDAVAYEIMDNRSAEVGSEWDNELLYQQLTALEEDDVDLGFVGFEHGDIDRLLEEIGGDVDPDDIPDDDPPEPVEDPVVRLGDLWVLGKHRVLCGDCTDATIVQIATNGELVSILITDPPYGVDYAGKNEFLNAFDEGNRIQTPIRNDAIEDYRRFFSLFLSAVPFADYNTIYVFMSNQELHSLRLAFDDSDIKWGDYLVWVKNNHVLCRKDYNAKHEFIVYGWKGRHRFYGGFQTTVLECNRPSRSDLHPTMKPIGLVARLMSHGSKELDIVYDPFLGSGTTLIAAEQLNRKCYGMEIEPRYVQVVLERWRNLTGKEPVLESTGQTLDVIQSIGRPDG